MYVSQPVADRVFFLFFFNYYYRARKNISSLFPDIFSSDVPMFHLSKVNCIGLSQKLVLDMIHILVFESHT